MKAKTSLEHRLWGLLKEDGVSGSRFCLACSGGADSVAMVHAFAAILPKDQLVVAHAHHGPGENGHFRNEAELFVKGLAQEMNLVHEFRRYHGEPLRGEAALRQFRRTALEDIRGFHRCDWIVTAHHAEDVFETRLIRLIRGSGPEGLVALRRKSRNWYRPFLGISRKELRRDLGGAGSRWVEDPSNHDTRFLRNWIRQSWLPSLEAHRPGSVQVFSRSLESLVQTLEEAKSPAPESPLPRTEWMGFPRGEQLQALASLLLKAGVSDFTRGQLEEIRRQLDKSESEYSFRGAGCLWMVNAQQIALRPVPEKA